MVSLFALGLSVPNLCASWRGSGAIIGTVSPRGRLKWLQLLQLRLIQSGQNPFSAAIGTDFGVDFPK
ncbi:MAG: hypothetical protein GW858_09950 [Sphingomonadales bacterium]|nr:hypothetical protein [Sphingomonadales bacterium]NCQ20648.1 hypothetical protein [Sphingomonadales bacterium]NCT04154.1 hypothetical protein [Sphingomonadales bacterium]